VVLLNRGRVEQVWTPEELYDEPATRFAAEFIGETNLIEGVVGATTGITATIDTPVAGGFSALAPHAVRHGDPVYVMIRPERIDLVAERPPGGVSLPATVVKRVFAGDVLTLELRTDRGLVLRCRKPSIGEYRALGPGTSVWAVVRDARALPRDDGAA
jgi:putative spermidine/putrescine transport system ATP-binding protein